MTTLLDLQLCFEGAVPAVVATADANGVPNVTYLSRVQLVDDERIALSNQFFSKTARNLAENPQASVIVLDPTTFDEYRLRLVYERTERRGPLFERLRADVDALALLCGMEDVFKLRAADVYRVVEIEQLVAAVHRGDRPDPWTTALVSPAAGAGQAPAASSLAELAGRLARCTGLDILVETSVAALDELFGYRHSVLLLLDEEGRRLYTMASRGYAAEGVGSEVVVGDGLIGRVAERCAPMRVGNLRQMTKYSWSLRSAFADQAVEPGREIPLPVLPRAQSQVAVPAMAMGQLVGVLVVESDEPVAFTERDEEVLTVVASLVAGAVEVERALASASQSGGRPPEAGTAPATGGADGPATQVRFFPVDGSTFLDGDYLIKGVAGRILWSLLQQHHREGREEFTNREVRLDPSLDLPAFRDNLESRLILLKRRLEERDAPIRIARCGRGRFRLVVDSPLRLDPAPSATT